MMLRDHRTDALRRAIRHIAGNPSCVNFQPMMPWSVQNGISRDYSRYGNHGTITGCVPGQVPILGDGLLVNGDFEILGDGGSDTFAGWTELTSGTSTVTQSTTYKVDGTCVCKLAVDASNSLAAIEQNVNVQAGKEYLLSFWVCYSSGGGVRIHICKSDKSRYWNFATGSWQDTEAFVDPAIYWKWYRFSYKFCAEEATSLTISFTREAAASKSIYLDRVTLRPIIQYQGMGLRFDGINSYIDFPPNANLLPDAFTFLAWAIPENQNFNLALWTPPSGLQPAILCQDFKPTIRMGSTNYRSWVKLPVSDFEGRWQHHAASLPGIDKTSINSAQYYLNGSPLLEIDNTNSVTVQIVKSAFRLGFVGNISMLGTMACATLYNRVLTQQEIISHYNLTRPFIGV